MGGAGVNAGGGGSLPQPARRVRRRLAVEVRRMFDRTAASLIHLAPPARQMVPDFALRLLK